jgi:hypothetical protein
LCNFSNSKRFENENVPTYELDKDPKNTMKFLKSVSMNGQELDAFAVCSIVLELLFLDSDFK